jgi:hypothetical protein
VVTSGIINSNPSPKAATQKIMKKPMLEKYFQAIFAEADAGLAS